MDHVVETKAAERVSELPLGGREPAARLSQRAPNSAPLQLCGQCRRPAGSRLSRRGVRAPAHNRHAATDVLEDADAHQ
jgi:hypothetical protein